MRYLFYKGKKMKFENLYQMNIQMMKENYDSINFLQKMMLHSVHIDLFCGVLARTILNDENKCKDYDFIKMFFSKNLSDEFILCLRLMEKEIEIDKKSFFLDISKVLELHLHGLEKQITEYKLSQEHKQYIREDIIPKFHRICQTITPKLLEDIRIKYELSLSEFEFLQFSLLEKINKVLYLATSEITTEEITTEEMKEIEQ